MQNPIPPHKVWCLLILVHSIYMDAVIFFQGVGCWLLSTDSSENSESIRLHLINDHIKMISVFSFRFHGLRASNYCISYSGRVGFITMIFLIVKWIEYFDITAADDAKRKQSVPEHWKLNQINMASDIKIWSILSLQSEQGFKSMSLQNLKRNCISLWFVVAWGMCWFCQSIPEKFVKKCGTYSRILLQSFTGWSVSDILSYISV